MSDPGTADGDSYAAAAAQGIHRIAVPTPFAVGRVNAYLIEDDPLTLVDSGPNSGTSFDELEKGLAALGHRLEEIELIVVTHQHIDHLGLVGLIAARSGAQVAALDATVPYMEDYTGEAAADDEFARALMPRHGISEEVATALLSVSRAFRAWGARADVGRVLHDGDVLELADRRLRVLHRPGHSPSDTVFHDADRGTLIAADHLLAHISSNPLLTRPRDGGPRPRALMSYIASLQQTRAMDLELVLPGHGDAITEHAQLIDERFAMHRRRAEKLLGLIAERPRTAHELCQALWGNIAVTQAYLTLSEVLGHTDVLIDEGRITEIEEGGVVRFGAV